MKRAVQSYRETGTPNCWLARMECGHETVVIAKNPRAHTKKCSQCDASAAAIAEDERVSTLERRLVELHDAVCRPNQPADHDFFGCALDGIHDWRSALDERQAEIDKLKAALRPCVVALDSLVHIEQGDPLSPPGPIAAALAGAREALDEADEPRFVMKTVEVGE